MFEKRLLGILGGIYCLPGSRMELQEAIWLGPAAGSGDSGLGAGVGLSPPGASGLQGVSFGCEEVRPHQPLL